MTGKSPTASAGGGCNDAPRGETRRRAALQNFKTSIIRVAHGTDGVWTLFGGVNPFSRFSTVRAVHLSHTSRRFYERRVQSFFDH